MITNKDKEEIFRLFNEEHKTKNEIAKIMSLAHPTIIYHLKRPGTRIVERKSKPTRKRMYTRIDPLFDDKLYRKYVEESMRTIIERDETGRIIKVTKLSEVSSRDVSEHIQNSICPKFFDSDGKRLTPLASDASQPGIEIENDDDNRRSNIKFYL